jgi:signal transduction histidine kinase
VGLHTARLQLDRDPGEVPASLDYLLSLAEAAQSEMRALIFELRPDALASEGLVSALSRQGAALQARYDIAVQTEVGDEPALPLAVKQELYRVAQEALQNAVKHAHANRVDLLLRQSGDAVSLEVQDNGVGFDPQGAFPGHLGLRSMQERVSNLGGTLEIESAPGQGTRILALVPAGDRRGGDVDVLPST